MVAAALGIARPENRVSADVLKPGGGVRNSGSETWKLAVATVKVGGCAPGIAGGAARKDRNGSIWNSGNEEKRIRFVPEFLSSIFFKPSSLVARSRPG